MFFVFLFSILLNSASAYVERQLPPFPLESSFRDKGSESDLFADVNSDNYAGSKQQVKELTGALSWIYPPLTSWDMDLGLYNTKSTQIRHISRLPFKIIFDEVYTTDVFGRRYAWVDKKETTQRFVILAGCSFTFGNGLGDRETLNHFLAQKLVRHYPYNYAMGGAGANTALALVQSGVFKKQIPEKNGVFIYVNLDHTDRATGKLPSLQWLGNTPYYKMHKGQLEKHGSFKTGRHLWTKFLLSFSKWYTLFGGDPQKVIPALRESDYELNCQIIKKMQDDFLKLYPKSQFLVYGHPLHTPSPQMLKCYKEKKISYREGKFLGNDLSLIIENDNHPNAKANEIIASELKKIIEPNFETADYSHGAK